MEPFGLLNLLSALLPKTEETPSAVPKNEHTPSEKPTEKAEENSVQAPPPVPPSNAYLEFLDRHDQRVKQTKKR